MACNIIEGYTLDCKQGAAGIDTLYFAQLENVSSTTASSGVTTAITMVSGKKFYTYQARPETADFKMSGKINNENGTDFYESTIDLVFYKMTAKNRNIIDLLKQNRLVALVKFIDSTNTGVVLVGEYRGGDITAIEGGSGKAMGEMNGYKVSIHFKEPFQPTIFTGSVSGLL